MILALVALTTLAPGETIKTEFQLIASEKGDFNDTISIGMFYPFTSSSYIVWLQKAFGWH